MGDDVCRGCHRFAHEVVDWNAYPDEQRALVFERLDSLLIQIIKNKIQLFDSKQLKSEMYSAKIIFREDSDPHCWIYALLKKTGGEKLDPESWGFRLLPAFASRGLLRVYAELEDELYRLSEAHYQRYVAPGIVASKDIINRRR